MRKEGTKWKEQAAGENIIWRTVKVDNGRGNGDGTVTVKRAEEGKWEGEHWVKEWENGG